MAIYIAGAAVVKITHYGGLSITLRRILSLDFLALKLSALDTSFYHHLHLRLYPRDGAITYQRDTMIRDDT